MNECRTDSKKHCMACEHFDYCDRANGCNGNCSCCDDEECDNNPLYQKTKHTIDKFKEVK